MAKDWIPDLGGMVAAEWTPVATAVVAALAVLGGQWLAGRQQARNQDRLERAQERLEGRCGRGYSD